MSTLWEKNKTAEKKMCEYTFRKKKLMKKKEGEYYLRRRKKRLMIKKNGEYTFRREKEKIDRN